jgi:hypothetical protein
MAASGSPDDGAYKQAVAATLREVLGDSAARAILFYTGEPAPDSFETKLRSILGPGAVIVLDALKKGLAKSSPAHGSP